MTTIRLAIVLGVSLSFSWAWTPAYAQLSDRWIVLTTTRTGVVAFDSATVDRRGAGVYEAWLRFDADPDDSVRVNSYRKAPYSHSLVRYGLNCMRRQIGSLSSTYYDSNGSALTSSRRDSLDWELVLPESRGEAFLREFCDVMDGRRTKAWLMGDITGDAFAPKSLRIHAPESVTIAGARDSVHTITIDTTGLSPVQRRVVSKFRERPTYLRVLLGRSSSVALPSLPVGDYLVYCSDHMSYEFEALVIEVLAPLSAPPTSQLPSSDNPN